VQNFIIDIMNQHGYWGIALLIAIENIFPPIPSEVILTFGGFMTTFTQMSVWGVVLAATIGSVAGAVVLYGIGRWFNKERLERMITGKIGHMLRLKPGDISRAGKWFARRGKWTVFFCRFIPVVRSLISIPAGMAQMNLGLFLFLTVLGTTIWNIVLVTLGAFFGSSWQTIAEYAGIYSAVGITALAVLTVGAGIWYYKKRIKSKVVPVDRSENKRETK